AGRGGAGGVKLLGDAASVLLRGGDGLLGRLERVDASFEGLQLRARAGGRRQELLVGAGPEAALGVGDPVELRLDLLEPPRLGLERRGEGGEVARALAQADLDVAELLRGAGELRREPLHPGE